MKKIEALLEQISFFGSFDLTVVDGKLVGYDDKRIYWNLEALLESWRPE